MGLLLSLWAPILLSAVAVFIASSLIHMVLGYHKHDYAAIPSEDAVMEALRKFNIPRGDYIVPHPRNTEYMKSAEYDEKLKTGPAFSMTLMSGKFEMGKTLRAVVRLHRRHERLRGVPGDPRGGPGRIVPPRVPRRGSHDLRELRFRPLADLDLVPAQVGDDREGEPRRADLRGPDGRHFRLAVAPVRDPGHNVVVAPGA